MTDLSKLNICFLAGTLGQGGAERQLFYILQTLKNSGTDLRLLTLTKGEFWEEPIRQLGIPVIWVGQSTSRVWRLLKIIQSLRKNPPDILQSQHFYTNSYASLTARILGFQEIGAIRNNGLREIQSNGKVAGKLHLHLPRVIAANSRAGLQNVVRLGVKPENAILLPNVVDIKKFWYNDRRESSKVLFLFAVGRLEPQKRFDRLIRIIAKLRELSDKPFILHLAGEGPERKMLERQCRDLKISKDIVFYGIIPDSTEKTIRQKLSEFTLLKRAKI